MPQVHRVKKGPKNPVGPSLPKDKQQGQIFIEADGSVMVSTWNGRDPVLEKAWPTGLDMCKNERPRSVRSGRRR